MKNKKRQAIISLAVIILFFAIFYLYISWEYKHDLLVSINAVNSGNVLLRLGNDLVYFSVTFFVIVGLWKKRKEYYFQVGDKVVCGLAAACLVVSFILNNDFSTGGIYRFFFYIIFVGTVEEVLFRGYVYHTFSQINRMVAILISGGIWGAVHAITPAVIGGMNILEMFLSMLNYIIGGMVMGYAFIYLYEKSKSILVPILIHALLDYGYGLIGIVLGIGVVIWYIYRTKRENHMHDDSEKGGAHVTKEKKEKKKYNQ